MLSCSCVYRSQRSKDILLRLSLDWVQLFRLWPSLILSTLEWLCEERQAIGGATQAIEFADSQRRRANLLPRIIASLYQRLMPIRTPCWKVIWLCRGYWLGEMSHPSYSTGFSSLSSAFCRVSSDYSAVGILVQNYRCLRLLPSNSSQFLSCPKWMCSLVHRCLNSLGSEVCSIGSHAWSWLWRAPNSVGTWLCWVWGRMLVNCN